MVLEVADLPVHVTRVVAVEAEEIAHAVRRTALRLLAQWWAAYLVGNEEVIVLPHPDCQRVVGVEAAHFGGHAVEPVDHRGGVVIIAPGLVLVRLIVQVPGQHAVVVGEGRHDLLQVQLVAGLSRAAWGRAGAVGGRVVEVEQGDYDLHVHFARHLHKLL